MRLFERGSARVKGWDGWEAQRRKAVAMSGSPANRPRPSQGAFLPPPPSRTPGSRGWVAAPPGFQPYPPRS